MTEELVGLFLIMLLTQTTLSFRGSLSWHANSDFPIALSNSIHFPPQISSEFAQAYLGFPGWSKKQRSERKN